MQVLVTGADGFIGVHLCRYLAAAGISFRRAVRGESREKDTAAVGNIDGRTDWGKAMAGMQAVIHLAARVHVMQEHEADALTAFRAVNRDGTLNLARQAAANGVRRFVYMSTIKVNGEATAARPFTADDPPAPQDPYAVSKYEAEEGLMEIAGETGMEVVIIRCPLVYGRGAGGNFSRLQQLVQRGRYLPLGLVRNKRSLMGVGNLCALIAACLTGPEAANRVLLASDGQDVSTPELIRLMARASGVQARLLPVPVGFLHLAAGLFGKKEEMRRLTGSLQIDSSSTRSLLRWQPPVTLAEGIRQAIQESE